MSEEKWEIVKLAMFDGTKKKLKATCSIKGVLEALDPSFKNELPARNDTVLDDTNANQKAQMVAKIKNTMTINYLTLCDC